MDPKGTIQAFVDAINSQDWFRLDLLVATDFVRHSVAAGEPPVRSRADLVKFLRANMRHFRTPGKSSSTYLLKAKKSPYGTISVGPNSEPWIRTCPPAEPWMPSTSQSIVFGTGESSRLGPNGTISLA